MYFNAIIQSSKIYGDSSMVAYDGFQVSEKEPKGQ